MALRRTASWLSRQRVEILIVFGLALVGGVCGWLLRDQLMRSATRRRVRSVPCATGLCCRQASSIDRQAPLDRQVGASLGS